MFGSSRFEIIYKLLLQIFTIPNVLLMPPSVAYFQCSHGAELKPGQNKKGQKTFHLHNFLNTFLQQAAEKKY